MLCSQSGDGSGKWRKSITCIVGRDLTDRRARRDVGRRGKEPDGSIRREGD